MLVQLSLFNENNFDKSTPEEKEPLLSEEEEKSKKERSDPPLENKLSRSVSSFIKIFIFFIQTHFELNSSFFKNSTSGNLLSSFYFSELHMSGIECYFPIFVPGFYRFLSLLVLPIPFIALVNLLFGLKKLCIKFKSKMQALVCPSPDSSHQSQLVRLSLFYFDKIKKKKTNFLNDSLKIWLFLLYTFYFNLCSLVIQLLATKKDEFDNEYYLSSYPWIQFNLNREGEYFTIFCSAIFFGFIYIILVPMIFAFICIRYGRENSEQWIGFFLKNYKENYWWYEFIWLLRRLCIALAFIIPPDEIWRVAAISTLLLGFSNLQNYFQPFENKFDNFVDSFGVSLILITYYINYSQNFQANVKSTLLFSNLIFILLLPFIIFFPQLKALFNKNNPETSINSPKQ